MKAASFLQILGFTIFIPGRDRPRTDVTVNGELLVL
jgi:hypothetical protein